MQAGMTGVNAEVLKWARKTSGLSLQAVSDKINKPNDLIELWEKGEEFPSYSDLEKLAHKIYKRPLAIFFFPNPPDEPDFKQSFRTLPDFEIENLKPETLFIIRKAKAMQISLNDLTDGVNPSEHKIFQDIILDKHKGISNLAKTVRKYLGISIDDQIKWKNSEAALKLWREAIQGKGIFVFKDSIKQKEVSGFCLTDNVFPIIYLNNSLSDNRQIFTLFHELAHILLNSNGLTIQDDSYINYLQGESKEVEVFSNKFAGEFLVPSEDFVQFSNNISDEQSILDLSNRYRVSREVILRRFLDKGLINQKYYSLKVSQYLNDTKKSKVRSGSGGGDYYATQAVYLGSKYLKLAFSKYHQGRVTREQLGDCLNIKPKNIDKIESILYSKGQINDLHI